MMIDIPISVTETNTFLNIGTFKIIVLKMEQFGFTVQLYTQRMQMEWQTG